MHEQLTSLGWLLIILTWAAIAGLNIFCFTKIFRDKEEEIPDPLSSLDSHDQSTSISQ